MATEWSEEDRRWFVDGEPVHAGAGLEMQGVVLEYDEDGEETGRPGEWFAVSVESRDAGQVLDAYATIHGVTFRAESVAGIDDTGEPFNVFQLRWPKGADDG